MAHNLRDTLWHMFLLGLVYWYVGTWIIIRAPVSAVAMRQRTQLFASETGPVVATTLVLKHFLCIVRTVIVYVCVNEAINIDWS